MALMWSGMIVLAYAGGSWLGSYAVTGLATGGSLISAPTSAENYWEERDAARIAEAASELPRSAMPDSPGNHVCEGCDAGQTRNQQLAEYLGAYYGSSSIDSDAATDEAAPDAPERPVMATAGPLLQPPPSAPTASAP